MAVRSAIGPRTDWEICWRAAGYCFCFSALHAEHEARDALRLVDLDDAIGELDRFIDFAVDQEREERAFEQHRVLRIGAQRGAIIGGG